MTDMREHIHQSNLIEGIDDLDAVTESLDAWDFLRAHDTLTNQVIRMTQKVIVSHQTDLPSPYKGVYRGPNVPLNVSVGNHDAPRWQRVDVLMDFWLEMQPKRTAWDNHVAFETIHPFVDGNGRTGRMLMWWQELREGAEPTLFRADDRFDYYRDLQTGRRRQDHFE